MLHGFDDIDLDEDLPRFGPGRPEKIIDYAVIEGAAGIGCSKEEIAAVLGLARSTLYAHMERDPEIQAAIERGADKRKVTLRRLQWKGARAGNSAMLIWLGKMLLGQRDDRGIHSLDRYGNPTDGPMRVIIELVGDPAPPRVATSASHSGSRLSESVRETMQLVG